MAGTGSDRAEHASRLKGWREALRRPRPTLRLRLTLLYGAVFLLAGAGLLTATYAFFKHSQTTSSRSFFVNSGTFRVPPGAALNVLRGASQGPAQTRRTTRSAAGGTTSVAVAGGSVLGPGPPGPQIIREIQSSGQIQLQKRVTAVVRRANVALHNTQASDASSLLEWSAIALGGVALLSIGLAWWLSGRALRPLRTMNARAREISAESLHQRLGIGDRGDELGELATTFDALLERLEAAFESQRRFVANASHELRTPITLERTLIEVALADPEASVDSLRGVCERVVASTEEQERLLDALLTLARSEAGVAAGERVDLAVIVEEALLARESRLAAIAVETVLEPAAVAGDHALLERLVGNLVDNAIIHNSATADSDGSGEAGWIRIVTGELDGSPGLRIANSGAVIPPDRVDDLFEPFRRGLGERLGSERGGLGLGLSIVRAVAVAHGAGLQAHGLTEGGLDIELRFASPEGARPAAATVAAGVAASL